MADETVDTLKNDYQSVIAQFRSKYPSGVILSDLRLGAGNAVIAAISLNDPGSGYLAAHAVYRDASFSDAATEIALIGAMEMIGIVPGGAAETTETVALKFVTSEPAAEPEKPKRTRAKKDAEAPAEATAEEPSPFDVDPAVEQQAPAVPFVDESAAASAALEKERQATIKRMESIMSSLQKPDIDAWAKYIVPRLGVPATKEGVDWSTWDMPRVITFNNLLVAASKAAGAGSPCQPKDIDPDYGQYVKEAVVASSLAPLEVDEDTSGDDFEEKMQEQYKVTAMMKHVATHNTGLYAQVASTMRNKLGSDEPSKLSLEHLQATSAMIQKQIDGGKIPPMKITPMAGDDEGDLEL